MTSSGSAAGAPHRRRGPAEPAPPLRADRLCRSAAGVGTGTGLTVYGCGEYEAGLFSSLGPRYGVALTVTDEPASASNALLASGSRSVSVSHRHPVTAATLTALSRAGVGHLTTRSVGYNHIDVHHAARLGISVEPVSYSPGSVADYTLMLMLMLLRHAKPTMGRTARHDYRHHPEPGKELGDLTVGVVGTGRIGTAVMDRLGAFGCRILGHDRRPDPATDHVGLEDLLALSDIVSLHAPLTAETHHLLNRRRIEQMKPGAHIVNTARGALIDTDALIGALERGHLGGAALDVVEGEEEAFYQDRGGATSGDSPLARLQRHPNVILSPHTAYYTDRALRDIVSQSITSCLRFEGRPVSA